MNMHFFEYEIDRAIPIPPPSRGPGAVKYPWAVMEVGDSFFVPGITKDNIYSSIKNASRDGRSFVARRVTENGVRGLRVWRAA